MKAHVRISREQFANASDEQLEALNSYPNKAPGAWKVLALTDPLGNLDLFIEGDNEPVQAWLKVVMPMAES